MPTPDPSPLSSEERALARRLAELDRAAEPSSALDARVMAAARGAVRPVQRRRRWPAMVGLAASLLLAVGIAWQLRPPVPPRPTPSAAVSVGNHGDRALKAVTVEPPPWQEITAASAPAIATPAPSKPTGPPRSANKMATPLPEPPIVLDTPAPESMAPAPPPPAPPPAEATQQSEAVAPSPAAVAPAPPARAMDQDAAREADQSQAGDAGHGDEPEADVPPATADSPAVRDAWLQRIQGLVDSGDIAAARSSLHAFEQRYPDFALPENLRALAR